MSYPKATLRDENGFAMIDHSARLHQTGVFSSPPEDILDHYHTRYSSTYKFKNTKPEGSRTRHDLFSGYSQNHHYTRTGLNIVSSTPTKYQTTYNSGFTGEQEKDYGPNVTFSTQTNDESGFIKNNKNDHPDARPIGSVTSYTRSFSQDMGLPYQEYDQNQRLNDMVPANNGFTTNHRQVHTFRLSDEDNKEWMKTTNVAKQEQVDRAPKGKPTKMPASYDGGEWSGFNRSVLQPPAEGTGSEQIKLNGPLIPNHKTGDVGQPYELYRAAPVGKDQERRILQSLKRDQPLKYQHVLNGANTYQTTYNLSHNEKCGALLRKGNVALNGRPGSEGRQPGDTYYQDMHGPYSTTTKRSQIFEATQQAYSVNQPKVIGGGYVTTGFTQNLSDPKSSQPWYEDMRAGSDVFSKAGARAVLSSQAIGSKLDSATGEVAIMNRRLPEEPQSNFARAHCAPPIPARIPGSFSNNTRRPRSTGDMPQGTVGRIQQYNRVQQTKNYGQGCF
jgi:hypothetical protein